jgi:uncharacterized membrane protein YccC
MATTGLAETRILKRPAGAAVADSAVLAVACLVSYWLVARVLTHVRSVSRSDDLLGGMWAVVATVFVYRADWRHSVAAARSRLAATTLSFALCLVYLLVFPFHTWGLAALIGLGTLLLMLSGRSDDTVTAGITTAVVIVVAALSPHHAWEQPILRLGDTLAGIAVGAGAAWVKLRVTAQRRP